MNSLRPAVSGHFRPMLFALGAVGLMIAGCGQPQTTARPDLNVTEILRGADADHAGYARADRVRGFDFPSDHGGHEDFKNEWWYFTGNLITREDRHFGYQFTVFRSAISAKPAPGGSHWRTRQIYLAHLALTDTANKRFYSDERFARGAVGLAGVTSTPFRVWLEDWRVAASTPRCERCFDVAIAAASGDFSISLSLRNSKPMVLHGQGGLSRKSEHGNNASYYYSYPRLDTEGEIIVGDVAYTVAGDSWFDHEWSTSSLEPDQVGWDWFSIQLNDHTELMLFQLRRAGSGGKNFLYGTYVGAQGSNTALSGRDFKFIPTDTWRSAVSGASYPVAWRILIPSLKMDLAVTAVVETQEMNHSFRYWEGAVTINGTIAGRDRVGRGYLEMTGYK